jgi:hypothetical protein
MADQHGRAMAKAVAEAPAGTPLTGPIRTKLTSIDLPLDKPPTREILEKFSTDKNVFRQRFCKEMLKLMDAGKLPSAVAFPSQVWHFGSDTLVALGEETCVEYALRLKKSWGPRRPGSSATRTRCPATSSEKVLAESGYEPGWDPATGRGDLERLDDVLRLAVPFAPGIEGASRRRSLLARNRGGPVRSRGRRLLGRTRPGRPRRPAS